MRGESGRVFPSIFLLGTIQILYTTGNLNHETARTEYAVLDEGNDRSSPGEVS